MPDKQQTFGQFETPPDVADLLLAFCVRQPQDRVLDPSCGTGAFLARAARWQKGLAGGAGVEGPQLWGIELDVDAAQVARRRLPEAVIRQQNFFTLAPGEPFDAIVGNPPYTRAEWFDRLQQEAGVQLGFFDGDGAPLSSRQPEPEEAPRKQSILPGHLWNHALNRRAGLHSYFFLHGTHFLREGGHFGFVVPNNWLDVAYGEGLKKFLLEHYKFIALIESTSERWFRQASVNTSLVVLERCSEPQARREHLIRFVQLRQPLSELIPYPPEHRERRGAVEVLAGSLLPAGDQTSEQQRIRVVAQKEMTARAKWGLTWRAPAVYQRVRRQAAQKRLVPLGSWAKVRRGFTTGANGFFYLDRETVEKWQIEAEYRQPLLKSLRHAEQLRLGEAACRHEVFMVPPGKSLAGSRAAAYVGWGEEEGWNSRPTCAGRHPWYELPWQEPAPLVLPKGIWGRYLVPLLEGQILVDQQLYQIQLAPGVSRLAAAALLNSSWTALQMEMEGRVNFGEGVLWLAGYEVKNLLLPDPRYLAADMVDALERRFTALAQEAVTADLEAAQNRPAQQALDQLVAELLRFSTTEAAVLADTLLQTMTDRQQRARLEPGVAESGQ